MEHRISTDVLIVEDDEVLLVKHSDGEDSWWSPPGGGLEDGESLQDAAIREVKEEAGIDVELGDIVYLRQFSFGGDTNNLTVCFKGEKVGGEESVRRARELGEDEVRDGAWFSQEDLQGVKTYPDMLHDQFWEDVGDGFPVTRYVHD